jgi:LuxR family transcriptional regulator, maltose regulon positive regulatory protein
MAGPLLETKLYVPRARAGIVPRDRLQDRLGAGATTAVTLVSAPAGFGKTTLLGEVARASARTASVAWLSLDADDNDPNLFWSYVVAALDRSALGAVDRTRALVDSGQRPGDTFLATLLNDMALAAVELVLVLDDFHVIESVEVQEAFSYLVDHLPPTTRVVIGTRADPALPLARLRARGDLTEIRAADLRFSTSEAAAYLNDVLGLGLAAGDVEALEHRTEGWIAALQLAGLSMQGRDDVHEFIAGFAGEDRYIVDYLVEEVLHRQPAAVRDFLLNTSILARMTGELCDAVTGRVGGKATLEALDRANLFVVSLDDRRRWYRYHHLFADVLMARLMHERPDAVAGLHRRASAWYELNDDAPEAIRHAMAGGNRERAAALVELALPVTQRLRQEATRRHWLEALPDELIRARPVLSNAFAGSLLIRGEVEGVEARLADAERSLDEPTTALVADPAAFRDLPAAIAVHRAGLAQLQGDLEGTMAQARRALDLAEEDDSFARGGAGALLGLAYWTTGDLESAYRWYTEGQEHLQRVGYLPDVVAGYITVADIRIAQGRLDDALRAYERGLELATGPDGPLRGAADMHVGIAEVARERNDLETATRHLHASHELGEGNGFPQNPYRSRVAMARLREAEGDLDGAIGLLFEAEGVYFGDFSPNVRPIPARIARLWICQGRLAEASRWAREHNVSAEDEPSYVREYEHATLARLLVATGRAGGSDDDLRAAIGLTGRLLAAALGGGRVGSAIDILVAQALAHDARGSRAEALESLDQAIAMAEPQGYIRAFLDAGSAMTDLLRQAARRRPPPAHVLNLLAAAGATVVRAPLHQPLLEPLSDRELDVLRLLRSDLDGPDIARELSVSLNTLRTHTKNVYGKLGVNSRRAAVRRAAELELL